MKKHLFALLSFLFLSQAYATVESYKCRFSVAGGQESSHTNFDYVPVKDVLGKTGQFNGFSYSLIREGLLVKVSIKNLQSEASTSTSFLNSRRDFNYSLGPGGKLFCLDLKLVAKESPIKKSDAKNVKLDFTVSALEDYKNDVIVEIKKNILFRYSSTGNQRMRSVIFQDGKLYTVDDDEMRDLNGNWCILQIQLYLDEDTNVIKGHTYEPYHFKKLDNNDTHFVYGYNFFPLGGGQDVQKYRDYKPFNMSCKISKKTVFTLDVFKKIVGDRIGFKEKAPKPASL